MAAKETIRKVIRDLPCKLTETERLALGDQLAAQLTEIDEKQEAKNKISADQRPIKKSVRQLQRKLKTGTEVRAVECEKRVLDASNEVVVTRGDTGEEIERRTMTFEERQGDFFADAGDAVEASRKAKAPKAGKRQRKPKPESHLRAVE